MESYVGREPRNRGQILGVPDENKVLRVMSAKLNATRRMGTATRPRPNSERSHGRYQKNSSRTWAA